MYTNNLENNNYIKAVEKVEKIKEFYKSLIKYCLVIPFLIFINLRFSSHYQWFWFPVLGWGMGLIIRFLSMKNYNFLLGKDWEEKKIREIIDTRNQ